MEKSIEEELLLDDTNEHPLSYEQLGKINWEDPLALVKSLGYEAYIQTGVDNSFIRLRKAKNLSAEKPTLKSTQSEGWKVHISILDLNDNDKNLDKAWMIVVQTSIEYQINFIKIVRHKFRDKMRGSDKCGKEITWYSFKDNLSPVQIERFLTTLTQRFIEHEIIPGPPAKHDSDIINGSNYFSYRNDGSVMGAKDPFDTVNITVKNQPERRNYTIIASSAELPKRITMEDDSVADDGDKEYNSGSEDHDDSCSNCCR